MKLFFILFFSLTLFLNADTITDMKTEQRVALIIGNNNYSGVLNPLLNPKNDAQAIKEVLESRGFEIIYRTNITKREFKESIFEFNKKIEQGGVGLLYYAGHGMEIENKNYLIPIDAKLKRKMDTEFESIELDYIIKGMQESKNRLNIIILDACRNNPFFDGRGSKGGLAKVQPIGLLVSYATGAGKIARENRDGKNGLFTKYLIHYMKQPLTLREVFYKTREKVYEESSKEQFPAIYDQVVKGNFYFTLATVPVQQFEPIIVNTPIVSTSSKWIEPTKNVCISNGGEIHKFKKKSEANWKNAKRICYASGGNLPSKKVLEQVITDCGGLLLDTRYDTTNTDNSMYQSCLENKGFRTALDYWSVTTCPNGPVYAYGISLDSGYTDVKVKEYSYYIRCTRGGESF